MIDDIKSQLMLRQATNEILFHANLDVSSHVVKKNNRPFYKNKATQRSFLGKSPRLKSAESSMLLQLRSIANKLCLYTAINEPIWVIMHFYFDNFYNKDGTLNKKLPDLSNLYQLPEDVLQEAGIIHDDNLIHSHDLSRKLPGMHNKLEIFILKHELGT